MFEKPESMGDNQWNFCQLEEKHGEKQANKIIANRLRELADIVENDEYPKVFGFQDVKSGPIISFDLTLSYPWGG